MTGEQGRHQPKGFVVGRDLCCNTAPAMGAAGSDGRAVPWLSTSCLAPVMALVAGGAAGLLHPHPSPLSRLFEYRGRVSPVPRVVPVKRPRVTIPLVRRVKATLPVKLFARSAAIANSSAKLKRESVRGCAGRCGD